MLDSLIFGFFYFNTHIMSCSVRVTGLSVSLPELSIGMVFHAMLRLFSLGVETVPK